MGETEPNSWLPCTLQAHGCGRGHNTMGELVLGLFVEIFLCII